MNPPPSVYVGIDVAKATLQMHFLGRQFELANTVAGCAKLCAQLKPVAGAHVVCEATGGYEALMVASLHQASCLVSVVNPGLVRAASQAKGQRAKSDPIDAAGLSDYGRLYQPAPTAPKTGVQKELAALAQWLTQLRQALAIARCQEEHHTEIFVQKQHAKLVAHLEGQIEKVEGQLDGLQARDGHLQSRVACLDAIVGVGSRTAILLLACVPELGTLSRGEVAALCGLAPYNHDSGAMKGHRRISGGRAAARTALYMAALTASRRNDVIKPFYDGLIARNKPFKVALTAVMRKLVIHMNSELKKLAAKTAAETQKEIEKNVEKSLAL